MDIPSDCHIAVVLDEDYDPWTAVDWSADERAAYAARHASGELTAYGVILQRTATCDLGREHVDQLASMWGCDVEERDAEGSYTTVASIPSSHLQEVACELLAEAFG